MIKKIGFDLDGTLYFYSDKMRERNNDEIYKELCDVFNVSLDEIKEVYGRLYEELKSGSRAISKMGRQYAVEVDGKDIVQRCLGRANVVDLIEEDLELVRMLERLNEKYSLSLLTASHRHLALPKLEKIGIGEDLFEVVLTAEDGSKSKGDMFEKWLELIDRKSEECIYVGDNSKSDIDVPKSMGMKTCYVGEYENADFCIEDIKGLEMLLG